MAMNRPAAVAADDAAVAPAGRPASRWRNAAQFAGFTPAAVLFGLFFLAPLGLILVYSFWRTKDYSLVHDWNLGNYRTFLETKTYSKTFLKTVLMGVLATTTTIALAMPFCYWLVRYVRKSFQRTLLLLVVLPFWTSYLLRVYSWVAILGDNGALNTILNKVGVTSGRIATCCTTTRACTWCWCTCTSRSRCSPCMRRWNGSTGTC